MIKNISATKFKLHKIMSTLSNVNLSISIWMVLLAASCDTTMAQDETVPLLPKFKNYELTRYDEEFFKDKNLCGEGALEYWMRAAAWRQNPKAIPEKYSKTARLLMGDPMQVSLVNKELQEECRFALSEIAAGGKYERNSRTPMIWIEIALRMPDKLEPQTLDLIRKALIAVDLTGENANHVSWINYPGSNGSNLHAHLTPLTLGPLLIDDSKLTEAGKKGLLSEINHLNNTGDITEFNVLESHWNGTASWEIIKKLAPDPYDRRIARMISERLWINRFLTWSSSVERITGPGSRMAHAEWMGTGDERALLATGMSKPIWLNFFFPWDGWDTRSFHTSWEQTQLEATIPDLPSYLQDLAWKKSYPNELQALTAYKHWNNYPDLSNVPKGDPMRPAKYVNYQTEDYTIGSTTSSWVVNTCVVAASVWWKNSRNKNTLVGSPERSCVLYPHYVFNGLSPFDKGYLYFEKEPNEPVKDEYGGPGGPWMREFVDYGRVGTLQDRNTLLLSYTTKPQTHHKGQELVKSKTHRASAAMFLFRWMEGTDGLYVNREPIKSLPYELNPGDWWFIEDGDVYVAVRPLKTTALKGNCKTVLEKRNRHIVLYQDNVNADNIEGISNEDWVKAQSGFVVEIGNRDEYTSFENFQDRILSGKVTIDKTNGYDRHIAYQRDDRNLEMKWHCYTEEYAMRQISGKDDPWPEFLNSPEFSVGNNGIVNVKDASLKSVEDNTISLLSCPSSKTWVAYQTQVKNCGQRIGDVWRHGRNDLKSLPDYDPPIDFSCPAGHFYTKRFPFGKVVIQQKSDDSINIEIDASYLTINDSTEEIDFALFFDGQNIKPSVSINGISYDPSRVKDGTKTVWCIKPYDKQTELLNCVN